MLANLDNEVIFKKAFTDITVFKAFVRDILGIEIEVEKIETEKKFEPKIGYVDFELDIFAESIDKRVVIEIQRIEYDHHFDRFLHYFLMLIAEQQKTSKDYSIERTVYVIVVLTAPYKISEKNGKPVLDEVLLVTLNPQTLKGEIRDLYGHQFVCLNPNHPDADTPKQIRDWLDLIYQSIHSPERPVLNMENEGIKKAIELISFENLTHEERTRAKNKEASRITVAKIENAKAMEIARNLKAKNISMEVIAETTGLSMEEVMKI
ncbi:MAG: PD-(D/E)XK nuclease family transposase [Bacteroidia bacterium]|nr:PD-(D/E)XK nuclease family transposase [Bacteroidia bacterium]